MSAPKTVPSRLSLAHLHQLLADGGRLAGPPLLAAGPIVAGAPVEVERTINGTGLLALAGRQHPVWYHLAVQPADTTFRVFHGEQLLTEALRTTTKQITRFKARNPVTAESHLPGCVTRDSTVTV